MAMGDYYCDHEANGAELVGSSVKKKQESFPAIGGKVTIQIPGMKKTYVLPVIKGLNICNAYFNEEEGVYVHELTGQSFEYTVTNIYKNVFTDEFTIARNATIAYCLQIAQAVEENKEYVETIFGLKFLSWLKNTKKAPVMEYEDVWDALNKSIKASKK